MPEKRHDPLFRYLDTNGNGTGTKDATGDYSSNNASFFITPNNINQRFILHRVMTYIEDAEINISLATYGGITALTNGIIVRVVRRDGETFDLTDGVPIKSNSNWARICYDVEISSFPSGNNYVHARWTFARAGAPIILNYGDKLEFVMRDSLTDLVVHTFLVQGYVE